MWAFDQCASGEEMKEVSNREGNGFITRIYHERPELARKHLRRRYHEGVQLAFEYFEHNQTIREGLDRFFRWVYEEEQPR
jgi:hypothetical protein